MLFVDSAGWWERTKFHTLFTGRGKKAPEPNMSMLLAKRLSADEHTVFYRTDNEKIF